MTDALGKGSVCLRSPLNWPTVGIMVLFSTRTRPLLIAGLLPAFLSLAGCGASFLEGTIAPPYSSAWTKCGATTKVRVKPPHSTVTVAYTEPTTGTDDKPLTNLAYTTIYYNAGDGPVIGKVVPASGKTGGAAVSQIVTIPLRDPSEQEVTVCVTATDSDEREGPASP
ncbi:MAG: hypothetical protein AABZ34_16515 [Nitrospirota bacterium]